MSKISVFIITREEEKNIRRCLESVSWADEVIVVDSESHDKTRQIAQSLGAKVYLNRFESFDEQKNFASSKTSGDWTLSLDADEVVTQSLRDELRRLSQSLDAYSAYRIRRKSYIFGRLFQATGTQDDKPIRFWKRGLARFYQPIHEKVLAEGSVGECQGVILHYTYRSLSEYMDRFNRYTSLEARYLCQTKTKTSSRDLTLKPILFFLWIYFLKQGFRDRMQGFIFSVLSAYYFFIKHAKNAEQSK